MKDDLTGHIHTTCQMYKCRGKAHAKYAGMILCRKHYKVELIKNYGSVKKAQKYIKPQNLTR